MVLHYTWVLWIIQKGAYAFYGLDLAGNVSVLAPSCEFTLMSTLAWAGCQ